MPATAAKLRQTMSKPAPRSRIRAHVPSRAGFGALAETIFALAHGHRSAKSHQSHGEEDEADGGDGGEAAPDDIEAGAAIEDGLGEVNAVGREEDLHEGCRPADMAACRRTRPVASCRRGYCRRRAGCWGAPGTAVLGAQRYAGARRFR